MICVECTNPDIDSLYSEFKSKYIKLTICPKCGELVDKYIEFDNVIIFLDILLLKPQAYRHLAYNVVEDTIFGDTKTENPKNSSFLARYKKLIRYCVLAILFEVYLIWAYEEKNDHHTTLMKLVLLAPVPWQYTYFICQQLAERAMFCVIIDWVFKKIMRWPKTPNKTLHARYQPAYFSCVLLVTTCTSLAVKCLPIIMLIWPYDNAMVASAVVDFLGVFNTIEALRINTGASYIATSAIVLLSMVLLICFKQISMSLLVSWLSPRETFLSILKDEFTLLAREASSLLDLARFALTRVLEYSS